MKFLSRFKRKNQLELPEQPGAAPVPGSESAVPNGHGDGKPASPHPDEVCLRLGDFLHRIPAHLLQSGPHDLQKEVRFPIDSLSGRIKRGETTINLAEIYRQLPEIFRSEVREGDKQQILYPWRKVISMIKEARPDEGGTADVAAENLAEKIRQKKPVVRGAGPAAAQTPILRGRGKQQASWFSRTTLDKGAEGPAPAPEIEGSSIETASAPTAEAASTVGNPIEKGAAETPAPGSPAPIANIPARSESRSNLIEPAQPRPAAPAEAPPAPVPAPMTSERSLSPESDPRVAELPPDLQRRLAMIKGDYERQLAELELARKTYAAEVDRLQEELNRTADRLDEERTANSVGREMLQQTAKDRDSNQQQIAELKAKFDALQKDDRLTAITAERDALLQQKAHLSSQISELHKRGASAQPRGDTAGASAVLQRQVEEFQRRITLMEAAQRDTALELAREKETRAKAEKLLAAAEKLQEQSANYMETAKAEIRKEVEASVKPREIEARKIQKELQDQVTQISDQNKKLAAELENARAALAATPAAPAPDTGTDSIHSQALRQLEEDIENYRDRLKTLLKERDAARAEAKAAVSGANTANDQTAEHARLQKEFESLRDEHAKQTSALEALRQERIAGEAHFTAERKALETRLDSLRQSLEAAQQANAAHLAAIEKAVEERAQVEGASETATTAELRAQLSDALTALKAATDELASLRLRFDEQSAARAELAAELEREHAKIALEREATAARLREESHSLQQQLSSAVQERDELARKHSDLQATVQNQRATHDELLASLERDHTSMVRGKEDLAQRLAEAERAAKEHAIAETELKSLRDQLSNRLTALESEAASARNALTQANERHQQALRDLEARGAAAQQARQQETTFAQERESLLAQHSTEIARREEQLKQLASALDEERSKAAALKDTNSRLDQERQRFAAERAELENQVAASARTATQVVEQSAAELAEYRAHIDSGKQALADAEERANVLDRQITAARADHERMSARITELETKAERAETQAEQLKQRLESAREDAAADVLHASRRNEEECSRLRRELSSLQTERDNLAQHRDELLRRLSRIGDEHKRLLEDLTSPPHVMPAPIIVEERTPENVIEVNLPDVLPPEPGNGIAMPRVRAMSIPPPKVHTL